jgi:hypothetical protein
MNLNKILIALGLILISRTGLALDPSVTVYVDHSSYSSANVFEFDIMIKASGSTSAFELRTFQAGLYMNPAWINSGTLTAQNVSTYSELSASGYNGSFQWNPTDKLLNCSVNFDVLGPTTCISTTVGTAPLLVTRVRLTNTADFTCSTPDIKFNYVSNISPLRLRTTFSWREIACTTNYEMFYPGRTYSGTAKFNGETYSLADADGKSPVSATNNIGFCSAQLTISAFLEGFYLGGGLMQSALMLNDPHASPDQADTIVVELRPAADPSIIAGTAKAVLSTSGIAYCFFDLSLVGSEYWIGLKHRNSIDTWSASPVMLTSRTSFNFKTL